MPAFKAASLIKWQLPMQRVLLGLVPVVLGAIYFFGWRVAAMLLLANAAGFATEYLFARTWKEPATSAVFVTSTLLVLSLPPPLPMWMAVAGTVFAVVFGKMAFGGFSRNVFNPALTGRAFLYICFGHQMTGIWSDPVPGPLGGFAVYAVDAVTSATPGMLLKTGQAFQLSELFWGRCAGTIGGSSVLLPLIGGAFILWKKAANYRIVLSGVLGFFATQSLLQALGVKDAADPLHAMFAGSFAIGILFYATDPISASQTDAGRWVYGAFVGAMSSLIGAFSAWPAGTMFAILLGNMFSPIMDHAIRRLKSAREAPKP